MDEENYMTERVDDQIAWYDKRSGQYQRQFKQLRIWQILCASTIPFLTGFSNDRIEIQITIGLLGVIVAILSALDGLLKPQQLWLEYRTTAETLKHQKFLFQTRTAPYHEEDAFHLFVENSENIISKENSQWAQQMNKKPAEGRKDQK